jgi:hypothetical protein
VMVLITMVMVDYNEHDNGGRNNADYDKNDNADNDDFNQIRFPPNYRSNVDDVFI